MPIAITPPAVQVKDLESTLKSLPETRRKIICFSGKAARPSDTISRSTEQWLTSRHPTDFDGTIFMQDTGHILFDSYGCGSKKREVLDEQIKTGERSFREVSEEMWGSLNVPFDDGFEVMESTLEIDPDFRSFHQFCVKNDIPFNVISAGLKPVLRKVLDTFLGEAEVRSHNFFSLSPLHAASH